MGGRSSTRGATTSKTDNSVNLTKGGVVAVGGSSINITDGGAFELVDNVVSDAMGFGESTVRRSLDSQNKAFKNAMGFGEKALNSVENISSKSIDAVSRNAESTADFSEKVLNKVMRSNTDTHNANKEELAVVADLAKNLKANDSAGFKVILIYAIIAVAVVGSLVLIVKR